MPKVRTYGLDKDTITFAARVKIGSGRTILPENLKQINKFVIGIKKLGLWDTMVCWPMRSIHNAGTGTTVYSLGGLGIYNGTMVNSPMWQPDGEGILFTQLVNFQRINIGIRTTGWTDASLCGVVKSPIMLNASSSLTLIATLDSIGTVNDATAKLSLNIFEPNGSTSIKTAGLTTVGQTRFTRVTPAYDTKYHYVFGQTSNIYDPANANFLIQVNNTTATLREGTGVLPFLNTGTDSFLFNTFNTSVSRADTGSFAVVFKKALGLNTSNLFKQLFRQTLGAGLNLQY